VPEESAAARLRLALEMYEFGEQMLRERLRRNGPRATDAEIDQVIQEWHSFRPCRGAAVAWL